MDFWPEFLASSWAREFVAGGCGGMAGIISGYPLDTLRIRQQQSESGLDGSILRGVVRRDGPAGLYRGMGVPLASVTFQNAMVFQIYAVLSGTFDRPAPPHDPPSYKGVALGGILHWCSPEPDAHAGRTSEDPFPIAGLIDGGL